MPKKSIGTSWNNLIQVFKNWRTKFQWPKLKQWAYFFKVLSKKEKYIFGGLILILVTASIIWPVVSYHKKTQPVASSGGKYTEGLIGQPRYINPLLAQYNDTDRDLTGLVFSGLLKYNCQGELILDLAENYTISDDGKTYEVFLKKNVKWHDNESFSADDIVYTIETIQDPAYTSPLRTNWQGVLVEKINQFSVRFVLKTPYAPFLHHLTAGILPRHLWQGIDETNFPLAQHHLEPVGTGPYQFKKLQKDRNGNVRYFELDKFADYYGPQPKIDTLAFKFYPNPEDAIEGLNKIEVDGLAYISSQNKNKIQNLAEFDIRIFYLPRYFAVFFNQTQSKALADKQVRWALNLAANKQTIVNDLLANQGQIVHSPFTYASLDQAIKENIIDFDLEKAKQVLEEAGWQEPSLPEKAEEEPENESSEENNEIKENDRLVKNDQGLLVRQKTINNDTLPSLLEIDLVTTDWPELSSVAQALKKQWEQIGAKINLVIVDLAAIQADYIKPRAYQALLFGEILGPDPDPFAFWHSSQKKDPGLNLALYDNKKADQLLEQARQEMDSEVRTQKYQEFQQILAEDMPAVFLYNPTYLYPIPNKIKGANIERIYLPYQRFCQIEEWYTKTKRTPK